MAPSEKPLIAASAALAIFVVAVLAMTLPPLHFSTTEAAFAVSLEDFRVGDFVRNLLLFMPIGFAVSWVTSTVKKSSLLYAFAACLTLSASIETLQSFVPGRVGSLYDIVANSVGGLGGAACTGFAGRATRWIDDAFARFSHLSVKVLVILASVYAIGFVGSALLLSSRMGLSHWDRTFPLVLGNEATGDRPWRGTMNTLKIFDRGCDNEERFSPPSSASLVADYRFVDGQGLTDATGIVPGLVWKPRPSVAKASGTGVSLAPDHWLISEIPAVRLTDRIARSGEFLVSAELSSDVAGQSGPARIVSLSLNPSSRNFTIAQAGESNGLTLRLRTAATTGDGRNYFRIHIPEVFTPLEPVRVAVSYRDSSVTVYVNGQRRRTVKIHPSAVMGSLLGVTLTNEGTTFWAAIFYLIGFVPIGVTVGLALRSLVLSRRVVAAAFVVVGVTLTFEWLQGFWGEPLQPLDFGLILLFLAGALAPVAFLGPSQGGRHEFSTR